jgi:ATP-binding cassette subfamily F protein 3
MLEIESGNRKEQKRAEAEARQKSYAARRPLEQKLADLESKLKGFTTERGNIESWLANEEAYTDANKAQLQEMLKRQAEVVAEIEALEWKWFEVQQKLEAAG